MKSDLLTPEEVAELLKISKYTVYEMVKRGDLKAHRLGRSLRFNRKELEGLFINKANEKREQSTPSKQITAETTQKQDNQIIFMGSHDISLDYVVNELNNSTSYRMIPAYIGSMDGLISLYTGRADLVGTHLFDEETGEYNVPYIKRIFSGERIYIVEFVKRNIGWLVSSGNPKNLSGWNDLSRREIKLVNRQQGAGTRILLDYHIKKLQLEKKSIDGYDRTETTHFAAAAAITRGDADFALGTESAARAFGLDFIPLTKERYDFVMKEEFYRNDRWEVLQQVLSKSELKERIDYLGGYDVENIGKIIKEVY